MRERLEAHLEGDLADAQILIQQQVLRVLDADAREEVREVHAGDLLEHLAEVERAGVDRLGHLPERKVLRVVFGDEFPRVGDHRRLGVVLPHDHLIADDGKVLREKVQQTDRGIVSLLTAPPAWQNKPGATSSRSVWMPHSWHKR